MKIIQNKKQKSELIDEYFCYQLKQFQTATQKSINLHSKEFWSEFYEWLTERKKVSNEYYYLLKVMNINCDSPKTAEIGKGIYDTITENKHTTLITPYTHGLNKHKKNTIIQGTIKIDGQNKIQLPYQFLITENPYTESHLKNWEYLFHNKHYTTVLGVYGKTYDKDYQDKIKLLEELKQKLQCLYKEESTQINDNYCHIITSYPSKKLKKN